MIDSLSTKHSDKGCFSQIRVYCWLDCHVGKGYISREPRLVEHRPQQTAVRYTTCASDSQLDSNIMVSKFVGEFVISVSESVTILWTLNLNSHLCTLNLNSYL